MSSTKDLIKKGLTNIPYLDYLSIVSTPRVEAKILKHPQIWQCCTPKSASTYLNKILNVLWAEDICRGAPVPYWNDRYQEPDVLSVRTAIRNSSKPYYSGHHHQRYTSFFENYFLKHQKDIGGGVIVQTRPLGDTLVSLKDMLEQNYQESGEVKGPWVVGLNSEWSQISESEKYFLVAGAYAFWHLSFIRSWADYPHKIWVTFDEITNETLPTVSRICDFFNISKSESDVTEAINQVNSIPKKVRRLNVGKSGRGEEYLPCEVRDYIKQLEDAMPGSFA